MNRETTLNYKSHSEGNFPACHAYRQVNRQAGLSPGKSPDPSGQHQTTKVIQKKTSTNPGSPKVFTRIKMFNPFTSIFS